MLLNALNVELFELCLMLVGEKKFKVMKILLSILQTTFYLQLIGKPVSFTGIQEKGRFDFYALQN